MKKFVFGLLFVLSLSLLYNVNASSYYKGELIPVNSYATVDTDLFSYNEFIFNTNESKITFSGIRNKSSDKIPVSINMLLFDGEKKNIGFLSYCTEYDYSSEFSLKKIASGENLPFYINVTKKYFHKDNEKLKDDEILTAKDVKYVSVLDDNHYCKVGGPTKYKGLTIDEILNGKVNSNAKEKFDLYGFSLDFLGIVDVWKSVIIYGIVILVLLLIQGAILNSLYDRMYLKTSGLSYLPIGSNYISVKLAFGDIIGTIYIIALLGSIALCFVGIGVIFVSLLGIVSSFAFIIDIVKLITKKYDLLLIGKHEAFSKRAIIDNADLASTPSLKDRVVPAPKVEQKNEKKEEDDDEDEGKKIDFDDLKDNVMNFFSRKDKEDTPIVDENSKENSVNNFFNKNEELLDDDDMINNHKDIIEKNEDAIDLNYNSEGLTNKNSNNDGDGLSIGSSNHNDNNEETNLSNLFK